MLGRALLALAAMEIRKVIRDGLRRLGRSLRSRPMGLPEVRRPKSQPLTHRDAERIRRQTHVPEEHK